MGAEHVCGYCVHICEGVRYMSFYVEGCTACVYVCAFKLQRTCAHHTHEVVYVWILCVSACLSVLGPAEWL